MDLRRDLRQFGLGAATLLITVSTACGPPPTPVDPAGTVTTAAATVSTTAPPVDPFAIVGELSGEKLPAAMPALPLRKRALPVLAAGAIAPPPASCTDFAQRRPASEITCDKGGLSALNEALERTDLAGRDAALRSVESCSDLPSGSVRALRAELAPPDCADKLIEPWLLKPPAGLGGAVHDALLGLALAGKLQRAVRAIPKLPPPHTKKSLEAFIGGEMGRWVRQQATVVEQLAKAGSKLRYYGRAVVAVEAGMADMRFVDAMRQVPAPEEYAGDAELTAAYFAGLEQSLDPRKQRGRDATLVGLGQLATVGVIRDPRVSRARRALGRLYGGRPIDALDSLMLPPLEPVTPKDTAQRLATRLPTFYAGLVIESAAVTEPDMLRALMERGLSLPHRIALQAGQTLLSKAARALLARARLELAQNYWRAVDINELILVLKAWPEPALPAEQRLVLALGLALRGGPSNAADMMLRAPLAELGVGQNIAGLEAIIKEAGPLAPSAAFNAALIRQIAAPAEAPASYWHELATRYRAVSAMLTDARDKADTEKRAKECEQTAKAIEGR